MNDKEIYEYLNSLGWKEHYVNDPYVKYYRFRVRDSSRSMMREPCCSPRN